MGFWQTAYYKTSATNDIFVPVVFCIIVFAILAFGGIILALGQARCEKYELEKACKRRLASIK